jgi:hypothetical protein
MTGILSVEKNNGLLKQGLISKKHIHDQDQG